MGTHGTDESEGSGTTENDADMTPDGSGMTPDDTGMTEEEKRRDQLLSAPDAVESDAEPRIDVTRRDGVTRVDIRDDADVRPGDPTKDPEA